MPFNENDTAPWIQGLGPLGALQQNAYLSVHKDTRSERERLIDKREQNQLQIERLRKQNADVDEALTLLDQHPLLERLRELIRKLLN